jgi:hypothetical protein
MAVIDFYSVRKKRLKNETIRIFENHVNIMKMQIRQLETQCRRGEVLPEECVSKIKRCSAEARKHYYISIGEMRALDPVWAREFTRVDRDFRHLLSQTIEGFKELCPGN